MTCALVWSQARTALDGHRTYLECLKTSEGKQFLIRQLTDFLLENYESEVLTVLEQPEAMEHYAVVVDAMQLFEQHVHLSELLLFHPTPLLPLFDLALEAAASAVLKKSSRCGLTPKAHLHVRITGMPACSEVRRTSLPRAADVGKLIALVGTVVRAGPVKLLEHAREYMCKKCRHIFTVEASFEQHYLLARPTRCPNVEAGCASQNITPVAEGPGAPGSLVFCRNYQEMRVQEQVRKFTI